MECHSGGTQLHVYVNVILVIMCCWMLLNSTASVTVSKTEAYHERCLWDLNAQLQFIDTKMGNQQGSDVALLGTQSKGCLDYGDGEMKTRTTS